MPDPICFRCRHFRQHQPLTFLKPGTCGWHGLLPAWLAPHANSDDYYAPKREIWSRGDVVEHCEVFAEKHPGAPAPYIEEDPHVLSELDKLLEAARVNAGDSNTEPELPC
jgi:hypothetical protein